MKLRGWSGRVAVAIAYRLLMLWALTLRWKFEDEAGVMNHRHDYARIWSMWHNRVLLFPYVMRRFVPGTWGSSLISASRDGALLADFVKRFGYEEGKNYPDNGVNFETFTNEDMLEMESLGPMTRLPAGEVVEHTERWELIGNVQGFEDEGGIDRNVRSKVPGR